MANGRRDNGVTLVEMLVVLGIIIVLAGIVVTVTHRIDTQAKENTLASTFTLLTTALEQFYDYQYQYPFPYTELRFPLDCNDFSVVALQQTIQRVLGAGTVEILNHLRPDGSEYTDYSGGEVLYYFLAKVPEIRETLSRISPALVTDENKERNRVTMSINNGPPEFLRRVVDPWGTTLRYDYYRVLPTDPDLLPIRRTIKTFPALISAGPDKRFGTADDIRSKGRG